MPTGIKFFNWIGTVWRGQGTLETPMLFALGFLVTFLFGGLPGVLLASPPLDFHVSDTYFVVAHFHYSTTRGATATRWSGPPRARRRGTTSPNCHAIRSERPAFELHYPHMTERLRLESHVGGAAGLGEAAAGATGQEHLPGSDPRNR